MIRRLLLPALPLALLATGSASAADPRLITYEQALDAALEQAPQLVGAQLSVDEAQAGVQSAQGQWDPNLGANLAWSPSRNRGFIQGGIPFTSDTTFTTFGATLSGDLPTGTRYSVRSNWSASVNDVEVDFGGFSGPTRQEEYRAGFTFDLDQNLLRGLWPLFNSQAVVAAQTGLSQAEMVLRQRQQQVLADAAGAYWSWVYAEEQVRIAEGARQSAAEAERVGRLRANAGEIAPVDVTRLETARVQAEAAVLDARNAAAAAADRLLLSMGERPGAFVQPATARAEVAELSIDVGTAVDQALQSNLDLQLARLRAEQAEIDVRLDRHGLLPTLSANLSAGLTGQDQLDEEDNPEPGFDKALTNLAEDSLPTVTLGATFSVPLGNRRARGSLAQSEARLAQRQQDVAELERTVASQVAQQVRTLNAARRRVDLADLEVRLAEQTLAAEEAREAAGRAIQRDVLDARNSVTRARGEAAKARNDYVLAVIELRRLQGTLSR